MTDTLNWHEITCPNDDYTVRKVPQQCKLPVYIGKNHHGHCLFIIELEGDHSAFFNKKKASVHGITVDLRQYGKAQRFVLSLQRLIDKDIFESLCLSLINSICRISDSSVALANSIEHLNRWKAFLAGKKARKLSPEEIRGLFAELHFLGGLVENYGVCEDEAVESWEGPQGLHQDFVMGNTAIEVKSLSGKERGTVRISSEDQLEGLVDNVYLKIFRLATAEEVPSALSLNDKVRKIETLIKSPDALEAFTNKLALFGYVPVDEYDTPKFLVADENTYTVNSEFPKIVRSKLPVGVMKVRYELELHRIERFLTDNTIDLGGNNEPNS